MGTESVAIETAPLDLEAVVRAVTAGDRLPAAGSHGAVVTFLGPVRPENLGRRVTALADGDEVAFLPPVSGGEGERRGHV